MFKLFKKSKKREQRKRERRKIGTIKLAAKEISSSLVGISSAIRNISLPSNYGIEKAIEKATKDIVQCTLHSKPKHNSYNYAGKANFDEMLGLLTVKKWRHCGITVEFRDGSERYIECEIENLSPLLSLNYDSYFIFDDLSGEKIVLNRNAIKSIVFNQCFASNQQ